MSGSHVAAAAVLVVISRKVVEYGKTISEFERRLVQSCKDLRIPGGTRAQHQQQAGRQAGPVMLSKAGLLVVRVVLPYACM